MDQNFSLLEYDNYQVDSPNAPMKLKSNSIKKFGSSHREIYVS